jgi:hypothetical protein
MTIVVCLFNASLSPIFSSFNISYGSALPIKVSHFCISNPPLSLLHLSLYFLYYYHKNYLYPISWSINNTLPSLLSTVSITLLSLTLIFSIFFEFELNSLLDLYFLCRQSSIHLAVILRSLL